MKVSQRGRVFDRIYKLEEKSLDQAFDEIDEGKNPALDEAKNFLQIETKEI